jgi:hypothetical protein
MRQPAQVRVQFRRNGIRGYAGESGDLHDEIAPWQLRADYRSPRKSLARSASRCGSGAAEWTPLILSSHCGNDTVACQRATLHPLPAPGIGRALWGANWFAAPATFEVEARDAKGDLALPPDLAYRPSRAVWARAWNLLRPFALTYTLWLPFSRPVGGSLPIQPHDWITLTKRISFSSIK